MCFQNMFNHMGGQALDLIDSKGWDSPARDQRENTLKQLVFDDFGIEFELVVGPHVFKESVTQVAIMIPGLLQDMHNRNILENYQNGVKLVAQTFSETEFSGSALHSYEFTFPFQDLKQLKNGLFALRNAKRIA